MSLPLPSGFLTARHPAAIAVGDDVAQAWEAWRPIFDALQAGRWSVRRASELVTPEARATYHAAVDAAQACPDSYLAGFILAPGIELDPSELDGLLWGLLTCAAVAQRFAQLQTQARHDAHRVRVLTQDCAGLSRALAEIEAENIALKKSLGDA